MRHLQARSSEAALDVETLIRFAAVENALVAADLLGDKVKRLDQAKAQLLALLVAGDRNVFNVSDRSKVVNAVGLAVSGELAKNDPS